MIVLVSGLGLMGASLAAALHAAGVRVLLHHHRFDVAQEAERRGWGTAVSDPTHPADLAVVCTPVGVIPAVVRAIAAGPTPAITDVGSTKAGLVASLADLGARYLGSHPMCGSHRQGLDAADPTLYAGRLAILTPTATTPAPLHHAVAGLWSRVGARLLVTDPATHDRLVAQASHVPHVLANITAALLSEEAAPVCAGGFRDTTRVAGGSPALWADILLANRSAVAAELTQAESRLTRLRLLLDQGDEASLRAWLEEGHAGRVRYEHAARP